MTLAMESPTGIRIIPIVINPIETPGELLILDTGYKNDHSNRPSITQGNCPLNKRGPEPRREATSSVLYKRHFANDKLPHLYNRLACHEVGVRSRFCRQCS